MSTAFERRVLKLREHVLRHSIEEVEGIEEIKDYDDITKDEIVEILVEKEIDHNPKDKKEVLYNLLVGE